MFIVLGASGHVGSVVAQSLLDQGLPVTAVIHDASKASDWEARGAAVSVVDLHDSDALRGVFQSGTRAFLLNPPADVALDTDAEERDTARSIVAALEGSGLEKVVLASTFGARAGDAVGDLSVLYEFERAALEQEVPVTIQRGAYYYSNWDAQLAEARQGTLTTMFPPHLELPMVAPCDLGTAAARRLTEPYGDTELRLVEGPRRYSIDEVASAFADALGHAVEVMALRRRQWEPAYRKLGFSDAAARAYARMTQATIDDGFPPPENTEKGETTLEAYIAALVRRSDAPPA